MLGHCAADQHLYFHYIDSTIRNPEDRFSHDTANMRWAFAG